MTTLTASLVKWALTSPIDNPLELPFTDRLLPCIRDSVTLAVTLHFHGKPLLRNGFVEQVKRGAAGTSVPVGDALPVAVLRPGLTNTAFTANSGS